MVEFDKGFSIVLCTHNGAGRLNPTLQHIAVLNLTKDIPVELILVNNASTDNTEALVRDVWDQLGAPFDLKMVNEPRAGKGFATETGYDAARYAYIITVDDDNWLRKDYLENALALIEKHPDVGIFQACNEAVFESEPPAWLKDLKHYLVIGSPIKQPGYFPKNCYGIWGAGMITMKSDWIKLRQLGFEALTSKVPGKAAGEDIELAIALLLSGKKIFYSDSLAYQHYMPVLRINWENLKKGFETFGYTDYYFFLYSVIFDAYSNRYAITAIRLKLKFFKYWLRLMKSRGLKNNIQYFFKRETNVYQLMLKRYYSLLFWFFKLSGRATSDVDLIRRWMLPLLKENPGGFRM